MDEEAGEMAVVLVCNHCPQREILPVNYLAQGFRPAVLRTEKRSGGGETAGTEPERNDRRRAAGGSTPIIRH